MRFVMYLKYDISYIRPKICFCNTTPYQGVDPGFFFFQGRWGACSLFTVHERYQEILYRENPYPK